MMTFYLSFAILFAGVNDTTVVGKVLMITATTNGINLRAYIADVVLPGRTDTLGLELSTAQPDGKSMALWSNVRRTLFRLEMHDSEGKPVKLTGEGERRLGELPVTAGLKNADRMVPVGRSKRMFTDQFNLSKLYVLLEGETYTLRVHTRVKKVGEPYQDLELADIPIKVGEIPP